MLKRNRMGRRYLRESGDKIDAVELERYIWSVAEDCAKNIKEQLLEALEKDYFEKDEFGEHIEIDVYLPSTVRKNTLPYSLEKFLYKDAGLSVLNLDITLDQEDNRTGEAFIWFGQEYDDNRAITEFIDYTETGKLSEILKEYIESIIHENEELYDIIMIEESRSKRVCSNKRNFIKEGKKRIRPSKKDIEEAIRHIAYAMASDLANADFSKDGKDLYKHVTIYANDEVDNDYILEWLENNGFEFFEGSIDGMVGEKFYNISCFGDVISSTQDGWDDVDTLEDVFYRAMESELEYSYIFDDLLDDTYYAESKSSNKRVCKKVAKSLKESKRKSFRGGGYAKKTLRESSKRFSRAKGKRLLKEETESKIYSIYHASDLNEDCQEIITKAMKKIDNDISYDPQASSISATIYPEDLRYAYVIKNLMADYGIKDIEVVLDFDFDDSGEEFYLFGGFLKVDGEELEYQDIEDWEDLKDSLTENLYNYFVSQIEKRSGRSIDYFTYERNGLAEYILDSIYEEKNDINIDDAEYIGHSNDILSHVKVRIETIKKGLSENHYFDKINLNLSFELDGKKYNKTFKGDAFDVAVEAEEYLEKSFF